MKNNPYVGPRPYERGDRHNFFGRDRDARDLVALILAEREVLFYAQSGAGKTSLLNAQVIPALEEEGFQVLPVTRVGSSLPPGMSDQAVSNIFVVSALMGLAGTNVPVEALPKYTLLSFLREFCLKPPEGIKRRPPLLILDQFEELFTTHQDRWKDAEGFFQQVREALDAEPSLGIVLAMREDHVAELDPYVQFLSHRLLGRYRMERLRYEEALEAVTQPAFNSGYPFEPGVAERLVENLCQIKVPGLEGADQKVVAGRYVEAVQLQVVCQQLWENLPDATEGDRAIQWEEVERYGNIDRALTNFYESVLAQTVRETGVKERDLRRWFSTQLITPMQTRGLVLKEEKSTAGLPNEAVAVLDKQLLIRADMRAGAWWYELVHDRLVDPILESNRKWEAARQTPLRTTAKQWQATKSEGLLYRDKVLKEASAWASANPDEAEPYEREFIEASQLTEQARMRRRRLYVIGASVGLFVLAAMMLLTVLAVTASARAVAQQAIAEAERSRAEKSERVARSRLLAAQGQAVFEDNPLLGLRLVLEAWYTAPSDEHAALEQSLLTLMEHGRLLKLSNDVEGVYSSARSSYVIFDRVGAAGELRQTNTGAVATTLSGPLKNWGTRFSPNGDYFVANYETGPAELRQTGTWRSMPLSGISSGGLDFCENGNYFFVQYEDRSSEIRRTDTGRVIRAFTAIGTNDFYFSPACDQFVVCGYQQGKRQCELYETSTGNKVALASKAVGILFSPHGTFTVLIYAELPHEIRLTRTGDVVASFDNLITWGVTFSPSESYWIAVDNDGNLKLYWADGRAAVSLPSKPSRVYVSPDSTYIVVGDMDGSQLYRVGAQVAPRRINGTGQPFFSPDGSYFVMTHLETNRQRIELYHAGTDQVFGFDSAYAVNTLNFSPDQTYFIITYEGPVSAELRRTRDGQLVSYFDRPFGSGYFSPDGRYLLAQFRDGASELWNLESGVRVADLGMGLGSGSVGQAENTGLHFDADSQRLIVWYINGRSYLLDLHWLESMRHIGSSEDLLQAACWPFKATSFFDESELKPYLENSPSQACR